MRLPLVASLAWLGLASLALADGPADNRPENVRRECPSSASRSLPEDRKRAGGRASAALKGSIDQLAGKHDRQGRRAPARRPGLPQGGPRRPGPPGVLRPEAGEQVQPRRSARPGICSTRAGSEGRGAPEGVGARGPRRRAWWSGGTSRRSTDRSSRTGWSSRRPTPPLTPHRYRLDVWFHGRGETLSEVNFIDEREHNPGTFTPADTIVLHPYGRYCNAFKFAGEVDVLEALEDGQAEVQGRRRPDQRPGVLDGRARRPGSSRCITPTAGSPANPGAGFAETPRFLKRLPEREAVEPTWYEKALWHLYDCTDYAANLLQCPTVAYSGELDSQKQAADVMDEALRAEEVRLVHIIGPATKHAYHPEARQGGRASARQHRRGRPQADLPQRRLRHVHAQVQQDELGDDRRAGRALGDGPRSGPGSWASRPSRSSPSTSTS